MAIQALAGIPLLWGSIKTMVWGLIAAAFAFFTKRASLLVLFGTLFTAATVALITYGSSLVDGLTARYLPPEVMPLVTGLMPTNIPECFGALILCRIARFGYDKSMVILKVQVRA